MPVLRPALRTVQRGGQQSKPLIKAALLENPPALWTAATLGESDDLMTSVLDAVYSDPASSDSVTYVWVAQRALVSRSIQALIDHYLCAGIIGRFCERDAFWSFRCSRTQQPANRFPSAVDPGLPVAARSNPSPGKPAHPPTSLQPIRTQLATARSLHARSVDVSGLSRWFVRLIPDMLAQREILKA